MNVSDASDNENPEFSEIDHEISSGYGEGIKTYTTRYSRRNRRALVRDVQLDMDNPDNEVATHSMDDEDEKVAAEEAPSRGSCTDLKHEISTEVTAHDEFNGEDSESSGKIGHIPHSFKEDFDGLEAKKYVDDYNVLTVVKSLKGKFRAVQEIPVTEHEKEMNLTEVEDRKSNLQTLREVSVEEEVMDFHFEKSPATYTQAPVGEELDINNNEVRDRKATAGKSMLHSYTSVKYFPITFINNSISYINISNV